jgi:hypothetical protein
MESSPSDLSSTATPSNPEYLNSSILLAFTAANMTFEHCLSDIHNWETTMKKSAALDASRSSGGDDDDDGDDCDSIAAEIDHLSSFQESIRQELSEAEDSWRESLSSFEKTEKDQDLDRDVEEIELDAAPDGSKKPLDAEDESEVLGCDNGDQMQPEVAIFAPEQIFIGPFKGRVLFRTKSDDETLSSEEDYLQSISSVSSDSTDSCSGIEIAETSETRRPEPLTINTQRPSRDNMATNESPMQASPMGKIMSSDLLNKGHGGMSLALASDILASQIYSQQSLLSYWLNTQLAVRCESEKLSPTKTHWLLGVPLIGSASKDGQVWLMGNDSDGGTFMSLVEDETLDDMQAF